MSRTIDVVGHLGSLLRYARALTRDHDRAEDLVQDALVNAYAGRDSFEDGRDLRRWLLSIVHNTFITKSRRAAVEQRDLEERRQSETGWQEAGQETAMFLAEVRAAFLELGEEQRAALHLVAIEGLSYKDAAQALDVPVGTLMSRLGRARAALRRLDELPKRPAGDGAALRIVGGTDGRQ
jgi:RNA polymerase sigma-70 factor (ECF subfamily)